VDVPDREIKVKRKHDFTILEDEIFEDSDLGKEDLLTYWALAYHADKRGNCWPSLSTIAGESRCSRSKIIECIEKLVAAGYVEKTARFDSKGDRSSNGYLLTGRRKIQEQKRGVVSGMDYPSPSRGSPQSTADTTGGAPRRQEPYSLEPDSMKESSSPEGSLALAALSPTLLASLREEAKSCGITTTWMDKRWIAQLGELARQVPREIDIVLAFMACLDEAPDKAGFFPKDFEAWRKRSADLIRLIPRQTSTECPKCELHDGLHVEGCPMAKKRPA
jgi:DNA-binding transcriptional MocR family regulator